MMGLPFTAEEIAEKKKSIVEWLKESTNGTFTSACRNVGVSRSLGYEWKAMDAQFCVDVGEARRLALESALDDAEDALACAIKEKNITALIFFLKCRGKARDYIDRVIMGFDKENPATVTVMHDASRDFRQLISSLAVAKTTGGIVPFTLDQQRALESGNTAG